MTIEYAEDQTAVNEHVPVGDGGYEFYLCGKRGDVEVWLNRGAHNYDGLAIGGGESRAQAIADAIVTLERAVGVLKGL